MSSLAYGRSSHASAQASSWARRIARMVLQGGEILLQWRLRSYTRRQLCELEPRLLRDIGMDRATAANEAGKPFWR